MVDALPERVLEAEVVREVADEIRSRAPEQTLAEAVDEHETPIAVERENRDVDFRHHRAKEHGGFLRAEALTAQRLRQRIHLEHHLPEGVVGDRAAGANREVILAKSRQEIRDGLQRPDDPIAQRHRDAQPEADQNGTDRHPNEPRVLAEPQEQQGGGDRRESRRERQQRDFPIVGERHNSLIQAGR